MKFEVVAVGHATVDFFLKLRPETAPVVWSEKRADSFVCFDFDDKTPVDGVDWSIGGNAVNTGIGLGRLGVKVSVLTEVGQDAWGDLIFNALKQESVNTCLRKQPGQKTDLSVILNHQGERTILSYHHPRDYTFPDNFPETEWVYLTSLGEKFQPFHQKLLQWMSGRSVKLAYNPGTYELLSGAENNLSLLRQCYLLVVNREEAGKIVGKNDFSLNQKDLQELINLGPKIVAVTDGDKGATLSSGNEFYFSEPYPADLVEKTGAGDAFTAGLLAGLVSGNSLKESLRWGMINGASVVERVGSIDGLLSREEILLRDKSFGQRD